MSTRYEKENIESRYERERTEFFQALKNLDRRSFLKVAAASMSAAASVGMLGTSTFQLFSFAQETSAAGISSGTASASKPGAFQPNTYQGNGASEKSAFKIAYISDSHLYQKHINDRFANALMRAVQDVNALEEQPDFVFYGGDLAQLGQPEELQLGYDILSELKAPLRIIVGEHDWYFDMGEKWKSLFGSPNWSFDHKGVHFVSLLSIIEEDFWTERKMTPLQRMQTVAGLDNHVQRPFTVGEEQRLWLENNLKSLPDDQPIVVFSHSPLYQLYKNWNFWTDDADEVQAILERFENVTVIHGHTHQLLTNRIGNINFHGVLSTAWPWPYAPQGMPELTVPMNRSDPFSSTDGCGFGSINVSADSLVDKVYNLWNRKPILVSAAFLNSEGENNRPPRPNLPSY